MSWSDWQSQFHWPYLQRYSIVPGVPPTITVLAQLNGIWVHPLEDSHWVVSSHIQRRIYLKPRYKPLNPSRVYVFFNASNGPRYSCPSTCSRAFTVSRGCVRILLKIPAAADPNALEMMGSREVMLDNEIGFSRCVLVLAPCHQQTGTWYLPVLGKLAQYHSDRFVPCTYIPWTHTSVH